MKTYPSSWRTYVNYISPNSAKNIKENGFAKDKSKVGMIDHPLAIQVRLILPDSEMSWDTTHFIFFY